LDAAYRYFTLQSTFIATGGGADPSPRRQAPQECLQVEQTQSDRAGSAQDSLAGIVNSIRTSQMLQLFLVGFLVLLLHIPIALMGRLVAERQERRDSAVAQVASKWGDAQSITGPALVIPYTAQWTETSPTGQPVVRTENRNAIFLPERLHASGTVDSENRSRGIFSVPVYRLGITVEGEFARPDFSQLGIEPSAVAWDRAQLAIGISDARAIQEETSVTWVDARVDF